MAIIDISCGPAQLPAAASQPYRLTGWASPHWLRGAESLGLSCKMCGSLFCGGGKEIEPQGEQEVRVEERGQCLEPNEERSLLAAVLAATLATAGSAVRSMISKAQG